MSSPPFLRSFRIVEEGACLYLSVDNQILAITASSPSPEILHPRPPCDTPPTTLRPQGFRSPENVTAAQQSIMVDFAIDFSATVSSLEVDVFDVRVDRGR